MVLVGSIYLDWLDDAVKVAAEATGYQWKVYDSSWLHRSRSSGGYDSNPLCVMWHHTAGGDNAQGEADYMCKSADARPIANICVDSKLCIVMAGGATNTNGSGVNSPMTFSRGTVAKDDMNRRAVGIEICNNGVGAPYPERQIDFLIALSNEINRRCGNQPTDVCTHQHYAPDRKIDPSKNTAVQGSWRPGSVTSSGSWNCTDLRNECKRRATVAEPEPKIDLGAIHDEGDPMFITQKEGVYWIGNGLGKRQLADADELEFVVTKFELAKTPLKNFQGGQTVTSSNYKTVINGTGQLNRLGVTVS